MIDAIRRMRALTSFSLSQALRRLPLGCSEVDIRDAWQQELAASTGISEQGWYLPPPEGIIAAIANPPSYERVHQPTYRAAHAWPRAEHRLEPESLLLVYASPVDVATGIIGDLSCSLYRGTDPTLQAHLREVWGLTMRIAALAAPGLSLSDLYGHARKLIDERGFENTVYSSHSGQTTNIGHTIPWCSQPPSPDELAVLRDGPAETRADLVSAQRRFVSSGEPLIIADNSALTIEPRLTAPGLPVVSFHVTVVLEDGEPTIVTEFEPLFDLFNMGWLHA